MSLARPALGEQRFAKICQCLRTAGEWFTLGSEKITEALSLAKVSEHRKANSTEEEKEIDEDLVKNAKLPIRNFLVHGCAAMNMGLDSKENMRDALTNLLVRVKFQDDDVHGQLMQAYRKIIVLESW